MNTFATYPSEDYFEETYDVYDNYDDWVEDNEHQGLDETSKLIIPLGPGTVVIGMSLAIAILLITLFKLSTFITFPDTVENTENSKKISSLDDTELQDDLIAGELGTLVIPCTLSEKYPQSILQWCDLITKHAEKRGLPPDLIAALIWQESGGNPVAYSSSGAVGLMQVMPRDGLAAGFICGNGPCFSNRPTIQELKAPEFNILYGTRMLANLLSRNGNYRDALKSYGPMDVGYYYADKVLGIYQKYGKKVQ